MVSMRWKRSNSRGISAAGIPIPVSVTVTIADFRGVLAAHPDGDGAFEGELQGVGEQVQHHLLPHLAVQIHRLVQRRAVHGERQAGPVDRRPEHAGQFSGNRRPVGGLESGLHSPGLDAREVQQGVDQLGQPQAVAVDEFQFLARLLIETGRPAAQFVDRSKDQSERGAEFVADVGEEGGLGAVEFGQRLGTLLLGPELRALPTPEAMCPATSSMKPR